MEADLPRFVRFAVNVMGVQPDEGMSDTEIAEAGIRKTEEFFHSIGMPVNLRELGIDPSDDDLIRMAASCARATGGSRGSAKVLYEADFLNIYRMAM